MYRLSEILDNRYYQYFLEHKNSDVSENDIYVFRDGQKLTYDEVIASKNEEEAEQ